MRYASLHVFLGLALVLPFGGLLSSGGCVIKEKERVVEDRDHPRVTEKDRTVVEDRDHPRVIEKDRTIIEHRD